MCNADIKYTDTKTSGSRILYFVVNVPVYICMCFSYSPLYSSLKTWRFHFSVHGLEIQYDNQNNNFKKRLQNAKVENVT